MVDLTVDSGLLLVESGWHTADSEAPSEFGLWASSEVAEIWLPSLEGKGTSLEVTASAPQFLPFEFKVSFKLNGTAIGDQVLTGSQEEFFLALPPALLIPGMNRLAVRSSHVESARTDNKGTDTRSLGVNLVRVRITDGQAGAGRLTRIVIPSDGVLEADTGQDGRVVVQDIHSLLEIGQAIVPGKLRLELEAEVGREVLVSCWGEVSNLTLQGTWRPANLVLIVCDTLRADIIAQVETPSLDALAAEGVLFPQAFSHAPMTLPSHTALFSSRYPHVSGVVNNGQEVPKDLPLLSDWMKRSGYETHAVASLGTLWLGRPGISLDRGFETFQHARGNDARGSESVPLMRKVLDELSPKGSPFFLFAHFADPHEPYRDSAPIESPGEIILDGEVIAEFNPRNGPHIDHNVVLPAGKHRIEVKCDSMKIEVRSVHAWNRGLWKGWLKKELIEGELMVPTNSLVAEFELTTEEAVQLQIWVADKTPRSEVPRRYKLEVARADKAIGELVAALKERDLWDRSLVIFTSDHGEALGEHGSYGHVQTLYDEQVHIPLMIKAPEELHWEGMRSRLASQTGELVRHIDLVPTALDMLGLGELPGQMGRSLLQDAARVLVTETHAPEAKHDKYACRDIQYKLIYTPELDKVEMYDVVKDPGELTDIFKEAGSKRAEWLTLLKDTAARWKEGGRIEVDESELDRLKAMGYL
ncbi:MAG: arylsulfatase A-like enzyme [Bacteroidia bacterium]